MKRARGSLAAAFALALTAAATTWVAMLSWRGFTQETSAYAGPLLLLGVVVAATGAFARWWRLPGLVVVALQVVLAGLAASAILTGSPIPVGPAWEALSLSFSGAVESANEYAAPVPRAAPGVHPLLITGGLACLLLVDLLACTLRRVPLAGLPLLAVYSVPVSLLEDGLSWWVFALTAAGFMGLLFLHETEQVARWGRALGSGDNDDPSGFGVRTGALRTSAGAIGGAATALAVFVPLLIPTLDVHLLDIGQGAGEGDINIENPMTDLRRDLKRDEDVPLVRVTTNDPSPAYLRISVLNRFSENEWRSGDRDVPTTNLPVGEMPALEGVSNSVPFREYDYELDVTTSFRSTWLPTQAPITGIVAEGDWRYDASTMDFLASEDDLSTSGAQYSMTAAEFELSAEEMARAPSSTGLVSSSFLELPGGIPSEVRNLAFGVTREAPSRFEKAVALQNWFREDGGFTYSLKASEGNGTDELVAFLSEAEGGRVGYCEQFASAMTVMARMLGIPARVAVGFLQPDQLGPRTWEYSSHDLHAWPELYFPGSGWVRFEPTPPGRAGGVPGYTTQDVPVIDPDIGPEPRRDSEELPERGDSASAAPLDDLATRQGSADAAGISWLPVLGGLGVGGLLLAMALLPRLLRRARRERRLGEGPEGAWAELRATALDLRMRWPEDRSPRDTRQWLVQQFGAPVDEYTPERPAHGADLAPDAVVALDRIVRAVEVTRYARDSSSPDASRLRAEVETCSEALAAGVSRGARRRAEWWPRSVLSRSAGTPRRVTIKPVEARYGGVVDRVG